jgi:hypothetical protein
VPGRLAAAVVVVVMAVVVGIGLLGPGGGRPTASPVAFQGPTATPTPVPSSDGPDFPGAPERGPRLPDLAGALPGDDSIGPLPAGSINELPNEDRLDFLFQFCQPECVRDGHWMDPQNPTLGSGIWTAGRPFHVREGFINGGEQPLGEGFDVVLYVTHEDGESLEPTYRFTSDFVLRGTSDRCGPTFATQTGPETCEWFVHDFPTGLPEGRFTITAVWEAPCRAWMDLGLTDTCRDLDEVTSWFSSGVNAPFERSGPSYTEASD